MMTNLTSNLLCLSATRIEFLYLINDQALKATKCDKNHCAQFVYFQVSKYECACIQTGLKYIAFVDLGSFMFICVFIFLFVCLS